MSRPEEGTNPMLAASKLAASASLSAGTDTRASESKRRGRVSVSERTSSISSRPPASLAGQGAGWGGRALEGTAQGQRAKVGGALKGEARAAPPSPAPAGLCSGDKRSRREEGAEQRARGPAACAGTGMDELVEAGEDILDRSYRSYVTRSPQIRRSCEQNGVAICSTALGKRAEKASGKSRLMLISPLTFYGLLLLEIIPSLPTSKGYKDKLQKQALVFKKR